MFPVDFISIFIFVHYTLSRNYQAFLAPFNLLFCSCCHLKSIWLRRYRLHAIIYKAHTCAAAPWISYICLLMHTPNQCLFGWEKIQIVSFSEHYSISFWMSEPYGFTLMRGKLLQNLFNILWGMINSFGNRNQLAIAHRLIAFVPWDPLLSAP